MVELKKCKLGELIDVTRGASLSGDYYATEGDFIRLTCGNFDYINNCFKENTSKDNLYYVGSVRPEFIMKKGDIITPLTEQAIGLLGSTAMIPEDGVYIQSQDVAKITCKENLLYPNYAYYLISSRLVKNQLSVGAQQTKIRHTSPDKIKDCVVWVPDLVAQKQIGDLLRGIDSKISLNRAINRNLEAMAKQLYDYWFEQFDFPDENGKPYKSSGGKMVWNEVLKREIPEGWEEKRLGDIAALNNRSLTKNDRIETIKYIDTSSLTNNQITSVQLLERINAPSRAQRKVEDLTILYSLVRPRLRHFGILSHPSENIIVSTGFVTIDVCQKNLAVYTYLNLTSDKVIEYLGNIADTAVSSYPSINPSDMESLFFMMPPVELVEAFNNEVESLFRLFNRNQEEINTLTRQRDELLPLLMNGQVKVGE